jgi:hypothetical protein
MCRLVIVTDVSKNPDDPILGIKQSKESISTPLTILDPDLEVTTQVT